MSSGFAFLLTVVIAIAIVVYLFNLATDNPKHVQEEWPESLFERQPRLDKAIRAEFEATLSERIEGYRRASREALAQIYQEAHELGYSVSVDTESPHSKHSGVHLFYEYECALLSGGATIQYLDYIPRYATIGIGSAVDALFIIKNPCRVLIGPVVIEHPALFDNGSLKRRLSRSYYIKHRDQIGYSVTLLTLYSEGRYETIHSKISAADYKLEHPEATIIYETKLSSGQIEDFSRATFVDPLEVKRIEYHA